MRLAIPSAPRPVRLSQIPGALVRVGLIGAGALLLTGLVWFGTSRLQAPLAAQRAFLERSIDVQGQVSEVKLPDFEQRLSTPARLRVIYVLDGKEFAASNVTADGVEAEKYAQGAKISLLVDPEKPTSAQEASYARAQAGWVWLGSAVLGLGVILALGAVAFELRRSIRREVAPLRVGALVWLTPEGALGDSKDEQRFPAHYFRDDVKCSVTASVRPGRRPVRNGDKVLAAVVPSEPSWARVVDEDLARVLGWYQ